MQKKATEIDPFSRSWALTTSYLLARQYDAAIADATQRLESTPDVPGLLRNLSEAYRCKGMKQEAMQTAERYLRSTGDDAAAERIQRAYQEGGYDAVLHWQIRDMERKAASGQYVSPVQLALLHAQLGLRGKTLDLLEAGYRERNPSLLSIQDDPAFDFLHSDERYRTIIRSMGLPPAY